MHSASCKVWWRQNNGLGLFFMGRVRPLSSSEGKSLCNSIQFWTILCFQLCDHGKALSCFSMRIPPCTKQGPYRNGLSISVEELEGPTQSPDLNPIEHLCDELERRLRARLIAQHQCPSSLMLLWLNGSKSPQQCSNIYWKAFPEE
jgi:hypothetical protein